MIVLAVILLIRIAPTEAIARILSRRRLSCALVITLTMVTATGMEVVAQNFGSDFADSGAAESSEVPPTPTFKAKKNEELLREGTLIPPTVGRIVPVGRRWGFAPTNPELLSRRYLETGVETFQSNSSEMISKQRPTRLGAATIMVTGRDLTRTEKPAPDTEAEAPNRTEESVATNVKVQHIILAENLMLQRIVEAVIEDSADDRWTISGEISEFRNQNRLLIHTAQRTNDN